MKRISLILALVVAQVCLFTGLAQAQVVGFTDDFDTFDANRWSKEGHYLGRSYLDPNNVSVYNGNLQLKLPAKTVNGAEIYSNSLYGYGSYAARMKLPNAPSSITGFFLYAPPDYASEIDIEIYNNTSRKIIFSTYDKGRQTHTHTMQLPFDPTTGFHEYRFDYAPGSVKFYADGKLMKRWTNGVPKNPMRLYTNAWYPKWLSGTRPLADKYVLVDQIRHTPGG